jgi:hypothetical protein
MYFILNIMKVLKQENPLDAKLLVKFINDNNIQREDIFSILASPITGFLTLFYYVEATAEGDKKGFWG